MNTPSFNILNDKKESDFLSSFIQENEFLIQKYRDPFDGMFEYNSNGENVTFFEEDLFPLTIAKVGDKEKEMQLDIDKVEQLLSFLEENEEITGALKKLYRASLSGQKEKLLMFKSSLWLEAEKSGLKLDESFRNLKQEEVIKLQKVIYGESVSNTPQEVDACYHSLSDVFAKNQDKVNEEERKIFEAGLAKIRENTNPNLNYIASSNPEGIKEGEKNITNLQLKGISKKVLDFYKKKYSDNLELDKWEVETKKNISGLSVTGPAQRVNVPSEENEKSSLNKINKVAISHEIEQHLLQWVNNNSLINLGFFVNGYDFISEGVADLNEDFTAGKIKSIDDLLLLKQNSSLELISILVCEQFNYDDAVEFMKIYFKLKGFSEEVALKKAIISVRRRKRFVSNHLPGASVKDTLYLRGKNWVIDYLLEGGDLPGILERYKKLGILKVGPEELELVEELKKEGKIDEKDLVFPLFIGKILADKLHHGVGSARNYLDDFNFKKEKLSIAEKKELIEILQLERATQEEKKDT